MRAGIHPLNGDDTMRLTKIGSALAWGQVGLFIKR
jgi:hypothetical protein